MSRLFKARYFKNSDVLRAHVGSRPSFVWRSIWNAGCFLKDRMGYNEDGRPVWMRGDHGVYTVNSAYKLLKENKDARLANIEGDCSDKGEVKHFWRAVWRMRIQSKIKLFTWRLFHNALPTASNLRRRGVEVNLICKVCGYKEESTEHSIISCWWARAFWERMGLAQGWDSDRFENIQEWIWFCYKSLSTEDFALSCYGAYMIWRNRNLVNTGQKGLDIFQSVSFAKSNVTLFNCSEYKFSVIGEEEALSWKAPAGKALKFNCDGSLNLLLKRAGMGCVVRDSFGVVIGAAAGVEDNTSSSIDAEGKAILLAMKWASKEDWNECIFETDCAEVFSMIQSFSGDHPGCRDWLLVCARNLAKEVGWRLSLVRREANVVADGLARKAAFDGWIWNDHLAIPWWIGSLI